MRWHLVGAFLLAAATAASAAPPGDAPATAGPSGSAVPEDPYSDRGPVTPAQAPSPGPAPSQQQAPAQDPDSDTSTKPPQAPPAPAKPASEQQPTPPTDKPAPAPVDQPAPRANDTQSSLPAPAIDVASAPPACRSAGKLVGSRDRNAAAAAKISLAVCVANANLAPLALVDAEASVRDVDGATAASFAMLDDIARSADPHWQIIALHAEGDLYASIAQRMMSTVPAGPSPQLHDTRVALLQPLVQPWLDKSQAAFAEVDRIAKAHPELRQQAIADAVRDSRRRLASR